MESIKEKTERANKFLKELASLAHDNLLYPSVVNSDSFKIYCKDQGFAWSKYCNSDQLGIAFGSALEIIGSLSSGVKYFDEKNAPQILNLLAMLTGALKKNLMNSLCLMIQIIFSKELNFENIY